MKRIILLFGELLFAAVQDEKLYKDVYSIEKFSIPVIKERKLLVDLVGGTQIGNWINKGYPLKTEQE